MQTTNQQQETVTFSTFNCANGILKASTLGFTNDTFFIIIVSLRRRRRDLSTTTSNTASTINIKTPTQTPVSSRERMNTDTLLSSGTGFQVGLWLRVKSKDGSAVSVDRGEPGFAVSTNDLVIVVIIVVVMVAPRELAVDTCIVDGSSPEFRRRSSAPVNVVVVASVSVSVALVALLGYETFIATTVSAVVKNKNKQLQAKLERAIT